MDVSWGLGAHGARGVGMVEMVEMVEVCVGFGFMLPRTEVLACLMIGPAIRHCSAASNVNPRPSGSKRELPLKGRCLFNEVSRLVEWLYVLLDWRCCVDLHMCGQKIGPQPSKLWVMCSAGKRGGYL